MSLGDRIKEYEKATQQKFTKRTPVIIRVDGKAFHTLTKSCDKPFDQDFIDAMVMATKATADQMQGCKVAYTQSDEATFLIMDDDDENTQGWFDYKIAKIVSVSAAIMSVHFNRFYKKTDIAVFDSRAFNVPKEDVINCFLWRGKDWERNSLQMLGRSHFSHKQLHGKKKNDIHEMLHEEGVNWALLDNQLKNGTFITKTSIRADIRANFKEYHTFFYKHLY